MFDISRVDCTSSHDDGINQHVLTFNILVYEKTCLQNTHLYRL